MERSLWLLLFSICVCFAQIDTLDLPECRIYEVHVAPSNSDFVYVLADTGLWKSVDRGDSWELVAHAPDFRPYPSWDSHALLRISYTDENWLYVDGIAVDTSTNYLMLRSTDGGHNWDSLGGYGWDGGFYTADLGLLRTTTETMFSAYHFGGMGSHGMLLSTDGGMSWDHLSSYTHCYGFDINVADPNEIVILTGEGLGISHDSGISWDYRSRFTFIGFNDVHVDPYEKDYIYTTYNKALYSRDGGFSLLEVDTDFRGTECTVNYVNPHNIVCVGSMAVDTIRQPAILTTGNRFEAYDSFHIDGLGALLFNKISAISSGYASSHDPETDYFFGVLYNSYYEHRLFRKDITPYGSARHYYHIERGWNLLSWCPRRDAPDEREAVADLFPDAILPAYAWNAELETYDAIDSLSSTQGFWLLSDSARVIEQDGLMTMDTVTVTLRRGWNLIGVQAVPLFVDSLESLPVVIPPIYKWKDGAYQEASALVPEQGYWVLCSDSMSIGIR